MDSFGRFSVVLLFVPSPVRLSSVAIGAMVEFHAKLHGQVSSRLVWRSRMWIRY
ncbi:hypothetical protein RE6C_06186 [Rhodopirellula europaea 6C]|uniref:Uncharacterized protein n=1 Tax=Rhodopirellula europaea 6C TaxID=1263867 RepID=M2AT00_9BACT|nr:hypothetical protein RE6C_06186 [Rhodopirellula europaea 6C]